MNSGNSAVRRVKGRLNTVKTQAIFGMFKSDPAETTRKKYQPRVDAINKLEPSIAVLSDEQLRQKTEEFKARVAKGENLNSLLPEAFAVGAQQPHTAWRMRHVRGRYSSQYPLINGLLTSYITPEGGTGGIQACAGSAPF